MTYRNYVQQNREHILILCWPVVLQKVQEYDRLQASKNVP